MDVWRGIFFGRENDFGLPEPIFMDIIGEEAVPDEQQRKQAIF